MWRRSQVAKASDCKSDIVSSTLTGAFWLRHNGLRRLGVTRCLLSATRCARRVLASVDSHSQTAGFFHGLSCTKGGSCRFRPPRLVLPPN